MTVLILQGEENRIEINTPRLNIGRSAANDLVLEDITVSGFHATIFNDKGKIEIVDQGSENGTFVNDQKIGERVRLKAWDKIRLGLTEFEVVDSAGRRPTVFQAVAGEDESSADGFLQLLSGGSFPSMVMLHRLLTIGRGLDQTLRLDSTMVSSHHARLECIDGRAELTDLGSLNGTYVNGRKIDHQVVRHGDRIRFDEIEYQLLLNVRADDGITINPAADHPGLTIQRPAATMERPVPASTVAVSALPPDEPSPPTQLSSRSEPVRRSSTSGTPFQGSRTVSFTGTGLQFLGYLSLAVISCLPVIPAAWGSVPLLRWLTREVRFSDGTRAEFRGVATQVWWLFALFLTLSLIAGSILPMILTGMVSQNKPVLLFLVQQLPLLFLLPLSALLMLQILLWVFSSIELSCGTRLEFVGRYVPFLGWNYANLFAPLTIIGWAWIHVAYFRWLCSQIEGGGRQVVFHGTGLDYLWRALLTILACLFIVPIPWVSVWLLRWLVAQIEIR